MVNLFVEDYKGKDMNILPKTSSSLIGSSGEFILFNVAWESVLGFGVISNGKLFDIAMSLMVLDEMRDVEIRHRVFRLKG